MMEQGMSESQIARAGYMAVLHIHKLAKLNRLSPEIAYRVEKDGISTTVAFEIAAYLTLESQRELAQEEKITGSLVKEYRSAGRKEMELGGLHVIEQSTSATMDEMLGELSVDTLQAIMADLPTNQHFAV